MPFDFVESQTFTGAKLHNMPEKPVVPVLFQSCVGRDALWGVILFLRFWQATALIFLILGIPTGNIYSLLLASALPQSENENQINAQVISFSEGSVSQSFLSVRPRLLYKKGNEIEKGQKPIITELLKKNNFPHVHNSSKMPILSFFLSRSRRKDNPSNMFSFLREGSEWLVAPAVRVFDEVGGTLDSVIQGLLIKTARILPNPLHNVIISYKGFNPSVWLSSLEIRNSFLEHLAARFTSRHAVKSIYLKNIGMEIFEIFDVDQLLEFVKVALSLTAFVSAVCVDAFVTDFDTEGQVPIALHSDTLHDAPTEFVTAKRNNELGLSAVGLPNSSSPTVNVHNDEEEMLSIKKKPSNKPRRLATMPNDPYTWRQWPIVDSGPGKWGIEAPVAWDQWTGLEVPRKLVVAVIDSGVDFEHRDLREQIWKNDEELCGNGIDDDLNGLIDDCIGWDFVNGHNLPFDDNGHGTASAGLIAAEPNNEIGLTGVCWGCKVMVLKALDKNLKGTVSTFARSIDYAIGKGVKVSNNSYGGRGSSFKGLEEAVKRAREAGMIFVAAAGNYSGSNDNDKKPVFPASYELDNVVSVAAVSRDGSLAAFSSYGKKHVHIAAPGSQILATSQQNSYRMVDGTSFAVPFVTGVVSLIWTRWPYLSYQQVIKRLLSNVKYDPKLEGLVTTSGTVDANAAVSCEERLLTNMSCVTVTCSQFATCQETMTGPMCVCLPGYYSNGQYCADVNECDMDQPCGFGEKCINLSGTYRCECRFGFIQTNATCVDINECRQEETSARACPKEATCINFIGTFDCRCPPGYVWNSLRGREAKCMKMAIPTKGPCKDNGGCGANSLCKVSGLRKPALTCECLRGYHGVHILDFGNRKTDNEIACVPKDLFQHEISQYISAITTHNI